MSTPILGLPELEAAQNQKYLTVNQTIRRLDALVNLTVFNRTVTSPPASPSEGDRYIVAASATGGFSGQENKIAVRLGGSWVFFTPSEGWRAYDQTANQLIIFTGSAWIVATLSTAALSDGSVVLVGVNTSATTTNRLAVRSPAVLFTPETSNFDFILNKASSGATVEALFQTGFSTRAQMGLLANDDFTIQTSPNGSTFFLAMSIDKDTGNVAIGAGSDGTNRLLVSGQNTLFTNSGNLSLACSKGAAGNDGLISFQNNFSARAQMGLIGNDDFRIRVSAAGSVFLDAIVIDRTTGGVSFPNSNLAAPGAVNLIPDAGRFCVPAEAGSGTTITGFVSPSWLLAHNGAAISSFGKKFYNTSTYGGTGTALATEVADWCAKFCSSDSVRRYRSDFWVAQWVAGSGTSASVTVSGVAYPLAVYVRRLRLLSSSFHIYLRAMTAEIVVAPPITTDQVWVDGVLQPSGSVVITVAMGWVAVRIDSTITNPQSTGNDQPDYLRLYSRNSGDVALFCLPALVAGINRIVPNQGMVPASGLMG